MRKLTIAFVVTSALICVSYFPVFAEITEPSKIAILALGDSLTAGTMDGVTFEPTQKDSWISQMARGLGVRAVFREPLINVDGHRVDQTAKPTNFAIPGLELSELPSACKLIDLVEGIPVDVPIFLKPYSGGGCVTPSDALLKAIDEANARGEKVWVFIWIGSNDLFFNFSAADNIDQKIIDAKTTDPKTFETEYENLLRRVADKRIDGLFVMTVPNLLLSGFFFTKSDLEFYFGRSIAIDRLSGGDVVPLLSIASDLFAKSKGKRAELSEFGVADILTQQEQRLLLSRIDEYNSIIAGLAQKYSATLIDISASLETILAAGVMLPNGKELTRSWGRGGLFSLDGIHPSPTGHSLIANEVIAEISAAKKIWLPKIDILAKYVTDPYRDADGDGFVNGPVWAAPSGSVAELLRAFVDKKD